MAAQTDASYVVVSAGIANNAIKAKQSCIAARISMSTCVDRIAHGHAADILARDRQRGGYQEHLQRKN